MWRGALWMKKGLDQKRIRHLVMEESLMLLTKMRRGLRQRNGCRWMQSHVIGRMRGRPGFGRLPEAVAQSFGVTMFAPRGDFGAADDWFHVASFQSMCERSAITSPPPVRRPREHTKPAPPNGF